MNRFRVWGAAAAVACATAAPSGAADEFGPPADARPWYKKMFAGAPPKPAGPAVRSGPVAPARPPGTAATLPPAVVQEAAKAEADALMRRMDVCLKLRQAAFDRNDEALMRQVDDLERQAQAVYEARLAALGVAKVAKAPLPAGAVATGFDLAPEKKPDPKAAAAALVAPAAPVPVSGTASAPPASDVREVSP